MFFKEYYFFGKLVFSSRYFVFGIIRDILYILFYRIFILIFISKVDIFYNIGKEIEVE